MVANSKTEETASGVATGMILSLRESLQSCKDNLATCQLELEAAKSEIQKWHSAFQNESYITTKPKNVVSYLQNLKSSKELLRDQVNQKSKEKGSCIYSNHCKAGTRDIKLKVIHLGVLQSAVRDLRSQLKPPSMQARRLLLDPTIHEEFTRLKNLVEEKDKKVEELEDNIGDVNFTPQSKMGKMLMAKCRTLQEEN
uniref:FKBP12-interacting protein of 37 kDa n=1 Tax=Lactuca sativa TaxID=4236 RepID=A0A9R1VWU3_LACSA|nr:hypothetical protein LSAT_V11C400187730 [Lactuca sativa]